MESIFEKTAQSTKIRLKQVPEAKDYGLISAGYVGKDFVCVSHKHMPISIFNKLRNVKEST